MNSRILKLKPESSKLRYFVNAYKIVIALLRECPKIALFDSRQILLKSE
jgi:hypothetical protein